ncbi:MAG: AzlC family ABC transporter permease [Clostridia bacterium]|nr:AzlC family ABC transporter permease [Clostridia bacterium]
MKNALKLALVRSLPVLAGYIVLGFGFGILSEQNGYGAWWTLAMSTFIYAGSMQYVTVSLLTSGASLITAALTTLMVNARHLFYGITMIEPYKGAKKFKPYLIFGLTDETYSLVCSGKAPDGVNFHLYSFFVSLFNQSYWVLGSLLGALAGALIPIDFKGVEFAMTALFLTVFVEQWKSTKNHIPAIVGVLCTVLSLVIFGKEHFLIPAMIAITLFLSLGKRLIERIDRREDPK